MKEAGKIAEELCIEAEKLGLCHPTERMIEEMLGSIFSQYETQISFLADDLQACIKFIKSLNGQTGWHGRQYRSACGKFLAELRK